MEEAADVKLSTMRRVATPCRAPPAPIGNREPGTLTRSQFVRNGGSGVWHLARDEVPGTSSLFAEHLVRLEARDQGGHLRQFACMYFDSVRKTSRPESSHVSGVELRLHVRMRSHHARLPRWDALHLPLGGINPCADGGCPAQRRLQGPPCATIRWAPPLLTLSLDGWVG